MARHHFFASNLITCTSTYVYQVPGGIMVWSGANGPNVPIGEFHPMSTWAVWAGHGKDANAFRSSNRIPDWPLHDFRAPRSGDRRNICCDEFEALQSCERVGRVIHPALGENNNTLFYESPKHARTNAPPGRKAEIIITTTVMRCRKSERES